MRTVCDAWKPDGVCFSCGIDGWCSQLRRQYAEVQQCSVSVDADADSRALLTFASPPLYHPFARCFFFCLFFATEGKRRQREGTDGRVCVCVLTPVGTHGGEEGREKGTLRVPLRVVVAPVTALKLLLGQALG